MKNKYFIIFVVSFFAMFFFGGLCFSRSVIIESNFWVFPLCQLLTVISLFVFGFGLEAFWLEIKVKHANDKEVEELLKDFSGKQIKRICSYYEKDLSERILRLAQK